MSEFVNKMNLVIRLVPFIQLWYKTKKTQLTWRPDDTADIQEIWVLSEWMKWMMFHRKGDRQLETLESCKEAAALICCIQAPTHTNKEHSTESRARKECCILRAENIKKKPWEVNVRQFTSHEPLNCIPLTLFRTPQSVLGKYKDNVWTSSQSRSFGNKWNSSLSRPGIVQRHQKRC